MVRARAGEEFPADWEDRGLSADFLPEGKKAVNDA